MKKNQIIVFAICLVVIILIIVSIKYLPLWSTLISAVVSIASFIGGWFAKKWWDSVHN